MIPLKKLANGESNLWSYFVSFWGSFLLLYVLVGIEGVCISGWSRSSGVVVAATMQCYVETIRCDMWQRDKVE